MAIPMGALVFTMLASAVSQALKEVLMPDQGSLLSGVSGTMFVMWEGTTLLLLGAVSGFALVHFFGRRFLFGVGIFVVFASLLFLYPIWVLSAATLEFAGRRLWVSTCGVWLAWDLALIALGFRMVKYTET